MIRSRNPVHQRRPANWASSDWTASREIGGFMLCKMTLTDYSLWSLVIGLEIYLLITMLRNRHCRKYTAFTAYISFQIIKSAILLYAATQLDNAAYFYGYWWGMGFNVMFILMVIRELFAHVFSPYRYLPGGTLTAYAFWLSLFIFAALALLAFPANSKYPLMVAIRTADRSVTVVMAGCLILVGLFSVTLGLMRQKVLDGMLVLFAFYIAKTFLIAALGERGFWLTGRLHLVGSALAMMVWTRHMSSPHVYPSIPSKEFTLALEKAQETLTHWKQEIIAFRYIAKQAS